MDPRLCQAHACTVAEVEVDDETGEVTVLSLNNAYEVGRALNPAMVEQQIVGGAWMGISHALYETTEPYYPDRDHGPLDFNEYLMPGPGDIAEMRVGRSSSARPPNGPYGAKGIGEMTANSPIPAIANAIFDACGVRLDRDADHARARAARTGRAAMRVTRSDRAARARSSPAEQYFADEGLLTAVHLALTLGRPLAARGRARRRQDRDREGPRARPRTAS